MKRANGKSKGPRMIQEIKRMNELGISRRKIALALSISRNTVDRYLEISDAPAVAPVAYSAPWSARVEWSSVKTATERGYVFIIIGKSLLRLLLVRTSFPMSVSGVSISADTR